MSEGVNKRLYSVKEAGRYLGRSAWAIRHLIWEKHLPQVHHVNHHAARSEEHTSELQSR